MVVLFLPDAQYLKVGVISPELLEGDQAAVVVHGQVVGAVQGCALAQSDGVHAAEFLQPVPEDEGT